jgi:2',3'-cyclic-nucleotide 2'-phosphodiesterase/3'-nucleotidase
MSIPHTPKAPTETRSIATLRLLTTTDLHGTLVPHDYIKDQPTQGGGLAGLSRLIAEARAQARAQGMATVLVDNGDTFQGTPLASHLAGQTVHRDHAIIASLNHLQYDAIGLGNHDLDHGMPYIKAVAGMLDMPVISSNLHDIDISPLRHSLLLDVALGADAPAPLRLGLLSVLPAQSAAWHSHHLGADAALLDPQDSIATAARALRDASADLVIVLAYMGVGQQDGSTSDAQAAHALAATGAMDALVLGHTHRRLPSPDYAARAGVDLRASTVGGVPAIMAGHAGSDLGVMDLELGHNLARGWHVLHHRCALRPNGANVLPDPAIIARATQAHNTVVAQLSEQVADSALEMHSYFSLVAPAPTQHLVAKAQHALVSHALADTPYADMPVLASAAAHGAGGRDGLGNYILVPQGPVLRKHIAGLSPFENQTVGITVTGQQLRDWLEHAALLFNRLSPQDPIQMLVNPDVPAFHFDTLYGLEYTIDPAAPALSRIADLRHAGVPVTPKQMFILATNQFRVAGGGGYRPIAPEHIAMRSETPLHKSLVETLLKAAPSPWPGQTPWRFADNGSLRAIMLTHPDAITRTAEIAHLKPKLTGTTPEGFIKLSVTL